MTGRCPTAASMSRTRAHHPGVRAGPGVHGRQRPAGPGGDDPQRIPDLPVRARGPGHQRWPRFLAGKAPAGRTGGGAGDPVHRGVRAWRSTPSRRTTSATGRPSTRWCSRNRPEAGDPETMGPARGRRDRQGPAVQARPRMRKILEDAVAVGNATARTISFAPRPEEGFALLPRLGLVQHAVHRRLSVPRPAAADHPRRPGPPPPATGRASSTRGSRSSTPPPAPPPRCACG